jgi:hypothetical protein
MFAAALACLPIFGGPSPAPADEDPARLHSTAPSVAGTVWVGEDVCGPQTFRFEPDGTFVYTYRLREGGPWETFRNGTWRQSGATIYIETNGKFAERRGMIRRREMRGIGSNVKGTQWIWWATRKR